MDQETRTTVKTCQAMRRLLSLVSDEGMRWGRTYSKTATAQMAPLSEDGP
jgi:hypothetical protein